MGGMVWEELTDSEKKRLQVTAGLGNRVCTDFVVTYSVIDLASHYRLGNSVAKSLVTD